MSDYLQNVLGVVNQTLRYNIVSNGFRDPAQLVTKNKDFVHNLCQNIRKNAGGQAASRSITAELEEMLEGTVWWIKYRYQTDRNQSLIEATVDQVTAIMLWRQELVDRGDPDPTDVPKYTDRTQVREWFEAIHAFLEQKCGMSGFPIFHVVREDGNTPAVDAGFGLPSFDADLQQRGRVGRGHFWRADNSYLFSFLGTKCHGTTAWNSISGFAAARDGRRAFWTLMNLFLGPNVKQLLMSRAETFLENARFDGRSRNFTFTEFVSRFRQA